MIGFAAYVVAIWGVFGIVQSLPTNLDEPTNAVWPIPQEDGSLLWMTQKEVDVQASFEQSTVIRSQKALDKIRFFLYTPDNPISPFEVDMKDPESFLRSSFNFKNPTRFMVHGYNGGYLTNEVQMIRKALLLSGDERQYNFIAVDWTVYAVSKFYISSQRSVPKTGKAIAEFIDWLHDFGNLSFANLALYGHSLGAHVVGFAGKNVKRGKVHTIVGLDPAMPLFNYNKPEDRLCETDALYVESIHTNGGMMGIYQPIGKASFYPNGGKSQPGCGHDLGCAHVRSIEYLSEALTMVKKNGFRVSKCKEFEEVKYGSCSLNDTRVRLGHPSNYRYASGVYYLETNSQSPFGTGSL